MSEEISLLLDEAAIRRVIDRYCHAVDRGSADEVATLFHEDGTLVALGGRYRGRAAIRQWYADYHRDFRSKLTHLRHKISNVLIELDGDEARVVSYMDADLVIDGEAHEAIGRYDDRFVREHGAWYFAERSIVTYHASQRVVVLLRHADAGS